MSDLIVLENIHRTFLVGEEEVHGLWNLSLTIKRGAYCSIMGPSGSGKSTLLNTLGLLDRPDSGNYLFAGRNTVAMDDRELSQLRSTKIGFIFQFFHLIPRLNALENIELPLVLAGIPPAERRHRAQEMLTALGLEQRALHRPDQLSGGQRQRVAIGRAAITRPSVLLADEPTGNLDRHAGREVMHILEQLHQDGLTLIMVTHDPELGKRASRRLTMMDGQLTGDR